MVDAPKRPRPRFPADLEPAVAGAIRDAIERLGPRDGDIGISSAACGGDILFAEAMLDRGLPLRVYLPCDEPTFLAKSVNFANHRWPERYRTVVARAQLFIATAVLGELPEDIDPFERTNLWMLEEAQRIGGAQVAFICLWNGEGGDGPGGTKHMIDAIRATGGAVDWIDIRKLGQG
jgi:hypothetical protein